MNSRLIIESFLTQTLRLIGRFSKRIEYFLLGKIRALYARQARQFLARHGVLARIETYAGNSTTTGCSYEDYRVLYQYVRKARPIEVLECGTGVSTVVIAHALSENEKEFGIRGRVTSMEELPEYYEMARNLFPNDLAAYADLVLSGTEEFQISMFRGVKYSSVPDREYDFVFVDGPNTTAPSDGEVTFDADVLAVIQAQEKPLSAMVDGRTSTCVALFSLFGPDRFSFDYLRGIGLLRSSSVCNLMTVKELGSRYVRQRCFKSGNAYAPLGDQ